MENEKLRNQAKEAGVRLWQIGDELGVSEMTIVRWLRKPLSEDKETQIQTAIQRIVRRRKEVSGNG